MLCVLCCGKVKMHSVIVKEPATHTKREECFLGRKGGRGGRGRGGGKAKGVCKRDAGVAGGRGVMN